MKQFVKVVIGALGVIVLGSVVSLVPQNNPQGQGRPAAPVNLTQVSVPSVPVTGAVGVSNFPAALTGAAVPVSGNVTANVNLPNPLPVQTVKQSANFVTLCWGCQGVSSTQHFFAQVHDNSVDTTEFALSQGQQFVVTDVSWLAECPANIVLNCVAGQTFSFTLGAHYLSVAKLDSSTTTPTTGRSDHLTNGFVVGHLPGPSTFIPALQTEGTLDSVILQGYIVP